MMKNCVCLLLALCLVLSLTACGEPPVQMSAPHENDTVQGGLPLVYHDADSNLMLMDVNSGKTRTLATDYEAGRAFALTSVDGRHVFYMTKADGESTYVLHTLEGDLMNAEPKTVATNVQAYAATQDGRGVAYLQDYVLYRVMDGGQPQKIAENVECMDFKEQSHVLEFSVFEGEKNAVIGDNLHYCYEDGTVEKTDQLSDGAYLDERFAGEWTYESEKLIINGVAVDDMPYNGYVTQNADHLVYMKQISGSDFTSTATLMMASADGTTKTVTDRFWAIQSGTIAFFLRDGSLIYTTVEETENGTVYPTYRYQNGQSTCLVPEKAYCYHNYATRSAMRNVCVRLANDLINR